MALSKRQIEHYTEQVRAGISQLARLTPGPSRAILKGNADRIVDKCLGTFAVLTEGLEDDGVVSHAFAIEMLATLTIAGSLIETLKKAVMEGIVSNEGPTVQ